MGGGNVWVLGSSAARASSGTARRHLNPWKQTSCDLQGGPCGRDHVVLTGSAGPKELWELVWEHGAHVLVSLGLPDAIEKVRGVKG